jgi:hypothetical protein
MHAKSEKNVEEYVINLLAPSRHPTGAAAPSTRIGAGREQRGRAAISAFVRTAFPKFAVLQTFLAADRLYHQFLS